MKQVSMLLFITSVSILACTSQTSNIDGTGGMSAAANNFLATISAMEKTKTQFSFDAQERYNWHYIPKDRKGILLGGLNKEQKKAAMNLLRTALSDTGYNKTIAIIQLEA